MSLSWSNETAIARALSETYPETDRLALSPVDLQNMIVGLPGFADAQSPPRAQSLSAILWQWMRLADDDTPIKSGRGG